MIAKDLIFITVIVALCVNAAILGRLAAFLAEDALPELQYECLRIITYYAPGKYLFFHQQWVLFRAHRLFHC